MPLMQGSSQTAVSHNIAKLIGEGYSHDQAIAIALSQAKRKSKGKKR
jgi:uncharacterized protein YoaH (UPF0181 family)